MLTLDIAEALLWVVGAGALVCCGLTLRAVLEARRRRIILHLLSDRDDYGLGLVDRAGERGTPLWQGPIYSTLRAMEAEGLLESYWKLECVYVDSGSTRRRRFYRIAGKPC